MYVPPDAFTPADVVTKFIPFDKKLIKVLLGPNSAADESASNVFPAELYGFLAVSFIYQSSVVSVRLINMYLGWNPV